MKRFMIPAGERATYYAKHWLVVEDGGSGTWLYAAKDGTTYVFIRMLDMVDACGKDAEFHFCAEVYTVDPVAASPETMVQAWRSCRGDAVEPPNLLSKEGLFEMACCLLDYGAASPLMSEEDFPVKDRFLDPDERHPQFQRLRKRARDLAEEILADSDARDEMLDTKIVNGLGQTAREYAVGTEGLWAALRRIRELGDQATDKQKLLLKLYGGAGQTLGAGPVPEDLRSASND